MLLYGSNCLSENVIDPKIIPLWEGIRLLLNRMAEALQYFDISIFQEPAESPADNLSLVKWINKILLACCDALLISVDRYHYSYRTRWQIFQQVYPEFFDHAFREFPQFLPTLEKAYEFKLYGPKNSAGYTNRTTVSLWFDTAEICDQVFRFVLEEDLGMKFGTYVEFSNKYSNHPEVRCKYNYYRLGCVYLPLYENLICMARMMKFRRRLPLRSLNKLSTPWHHYVFSLIPVIYFGLSRDGAIEMNMLQKVRETLRAVESLRPSSEDSFAEWQYLKERLVRLWYYICYGKPIS